MRKHLLALISLLILPLALACGGSNQPSTPTPGPAASTSTPAADASPTVAPNASATPATSLAGLSLIYLDTSKGQGADIYVASATGDQPKLLTTLIGAGRPLGVMGKTLALAGPGGLKLVNLVDGQAHNVGTSDVFDGHFLDASTFLYSSRAGCGGSTVTDTTLYMVDTGTYAQKALYSQPGNLTIAGVDAATGRAAIAPRGCDVSVTGYSVIDVSSGKLGPTFGATGCGWIIAAPSQNKAVASWLSCTPPAEHANADATVYDYGIVGPTGHDVTAPDAGSNAEAWLLRPGSADAALGTRVVSGSGPGNTRAGGVYLLDLASRVFTQIVPPDGAEQMPQAWSSDGRYLLYGVVEAQGVCHYGIVDLANATSPAIMPVNAAVTFCGTNGSVAGWAELK